MSDSLASLRQQFGDRHSYYPQLARVAGGAAAAILLDYLLAQASADAIVALDAAAAIANATGLNAAELKTARQQLRDRDLLREQLAPDGRVTGQVPLALLHQRLTAFAQLLAAPSAATAAATNVDDCFPTRHQPPEIKTTPHYRFVGPWRSPEQLAQFQRALIDYFKHQGARHPDDKAFWTIDGLSKGLVSSYWDEFIAGQPLGTSQQVQRDWELAPGQPYPAFAEDRIQYYRQRGEPIEAAVERARRELRDPVKGQDLWDGFLRKCDRLADEARQAKALGVRTPYLPPAFTERQLPTKQSVMAKLAAIAPAPAAVPAPPEPSPLPASPAAPTKTPLATLRSLYESPLGRQIVEQQLAAYPEWGYAICDGKVVERHETAGEPHGKTQPD
ncbi:MAG: hypothetical protein HC910_19270 [Spirulinaceae cyanobacterium SM2_1_0]|nr:hypothetical protein [Spirulinaceae cyanobacterium SM2_1_0]